MANLNTVPAQYMDQESEFLKGKVTSVLEETTTSITGEPTPVQLLTVKITSGEDSGRSIQVRHGGKFILSEGDMVKEGERVIINKLTMDGELSYHIYDTDRIFGMEIMLFLFFVLVVGLAGWKGLTSVLGLAVSIGVLVAYIVPQILAGKDPLLISLSGSLIIVCTSLFLAHGFNKRTLLAFASTLITLVFAALLAIAFVSLTKLTGSGSEETLFLQADSFPQLNLRGLLLGGIIIGTLGVLDDITTAQTAAIDELKKANIKLNFKDLYSRGLSIGKEHIASLVNTLVLAYAGASLPLLLLFTINSDIPFWVTLNGEFIAEEVIRTLVGSVALVLAVPISTSLAAYSYGRIKKR